MKSQNSIVFWALVIIPLVGIVFFQNRANNAQLAPVDNSTGMATSTENSREITLTEEGGILFEGEGLNVEQISAEVEEPENIPKPRPLVFSSAYDEESKIRVRSTVDELWGHIDENPYNYGAWIQLGLWYKTLSDYKGAEEVWKFATETHPSVFLAHANLANLYAYELQKPILADEKFLKAIELGPRQEYLYFQAVEFYRDVLGNLAKARDVADRGVEALPQSEDLKALRASLN